MCKKTKKSTNKTHSKGNGKSSGVSEIPIKPRVIIDSKTSPADIKNKLLKDQK